MTPPVATVHPSTRSVPVVVPVPLPAPGHPGCYWDCERATWVRCASVPLPRPPQD